MKGPRLLIAVLLFALHAIGCAQTASATSISLLDDRGATLTLNASPRRIVERG